MVESVVASTILSPRSQLWLWGANFVCKLTTVKFHHKWPDIFSCACFSAELASSVQVKVVGFKSPAPICQAGALGSPDTSNVGLEFEVVDPGPGFSSNARSQCFSSGPGFFWSLLSQVGAISPQAV